MDSVSGSPLRSSSLRESQDELISQEAELRKAAEMRAAARRAKRESQEEKGNPVISAAFEVHQKNQQVSCICAKKG